MTSPPDSPHPAALGRRERMALAAVAALLAVLLVWLRGGLHPEAPLEQLARRSPELPAALTSGRPTLVEFYADWCEACRAMAPAMEALERRRGEELNVVLLNVDNPRWQAEVERYKVNGIPQLEFFDEAGRNVGRSLGVRTAAELDAIGAALVTGASLPELAGVGAISSLAPAAAADAGASPSTTAPGSMVGPRSHG